MNDSHPPRLLSLSLEQSIVSYQHVVGIIMAFINIPMCVLIIFDKDKRNLRYRKYSLSVLIFLILAEIWTVTGVPIFILEHGVVYCAGYIPDGMSIVFIALFFEYASSTLSCMYYRRNSILNDVTLSEWTKTGVLVSLRIYPAVILLAMYLLLPQMQGSRKNAPKDLRWLSDYLHVMYLVFNEYAICLMIVVLIYTIATAIIFGRWTFEAFREVKNGMKHSCPATRQFQRRAVTRLILESFIPTTVYYVPILTEFLLLLYSSVVNVETPSQHRTVASISAIVCSFVTLHTIIRAITTVATNPTHRLTVLRIFCRRKNSIQVSSVERTVVHVLKP